MIKKWQSRMATAGYIECWTVVERSTWQLFRTDQTLTCPVGKAEEDPMFQQAYGWMKRSMADAGLHAPAPDLSPWWCWVQRGEDSRRPYLEDLAGYEDPVVLQLAIASSQIALSCFDLWHFVLNRSYLPASDEDAAEFDSVLALNEAGSAAAALLEQRLQESWLAIFELDQSRMGMGAFESKSIQGCFWTLEYADVTAVFEQEELASYDTPIS